MAKPVRPMPDVHVAAGPEQVGDIMAVRIQIADNFGLAISLLWPQEIARALSKQIKAAVEAAEVAVIKPPSGVIAP
jgi:hypothetical protein